MPFAQDPAPPPHALCVLAPEAWKSALAPFVEARNRDLAVELVTLEHVLATTEGVDPPERVKRFLFTAWKERRARYALLVGDADVFPVRFMLLDRVTPAAFDHAFYPCDLYYADLARSDASFDDWNAEKEGVHARYFGEVRGEKHKSGPIDFDRISYVPELAVGRWPVSDEVALRAVVAKTLAAGLPTAPSHAIFVHPPGWVDVRDRLSKLGDPLVRAGIHVSRLFFSENPAALAVDSERVAGLVIGGRPQFVFHCGHGTQDGWQHCLDSIEPYRSAAPAVYFSVGCNTAEFCVEPPYHPYLDVDLVQHAGTNAGEVFAAPPPPPACLQPGDLNLTGLGERLVRMPEGGAVVYIGCATGAQPCAVTLLSGFSDALCDPQIRRAGDAWRAAIEHYHAAEQLAKLVPTADWYPPSIFFQGMKFLYFGDPTLPIRP